MHYAGTVALSSFELIEKVVLILENYFRQCVSASFTVDPAKKNPTKKKCKKPGWILIVAA